VAFPLPCKTAKLRLSLWTQWAGRRMVAKIAGDRFVRGIDACRTGFHRRGQGGSIYRGEASKKTHGSMEAGWRHGQSLCPCVHVCMCACLCVCVHVQCNAVNGKPKKACFPCIHGYIHGYIHTYIHTYIGVHTTSTCLDEEMNAHGTCT
jgi:hypothetical protein